MSQPNVERTIGRLVTDERFRRRFTSDPQATLDELTRFGVELTPSELYALVALDLRHIVRLASAIDPRLQKADLQGDVR